MPPKRDITKYSNYFTMEIPGSVGQALIIIALGIIAGALASFIIHGSGASLFSTLLLGAGSGMLIISLPALITVLIIRMIKRNMKIKHVFFAVMAVSAAYSVFIVAIAAVYSVFGSDALTDVLLLLSNASIYGYWFIINRIAVGQRRSAIFTAEIQPILNVLFYFPFGGYLFRLGVPITTALIKLFSGMFVFLVMGYTILYLFDRPAKKQLSVSSVDLFSAMIGHWLFNVAADAKILGTGGVKRSVEVDVAVLSAGGKSKAIFIKPDIHYGPFGNVGGSVFTDNIGSMIVSRYNATPFVIHSAVNIEDNPMTTTQVYSLSRMTCSYVDMIGASRQRDAYGYLGFGKDRPCRAINVHINGFNMLTLSKAPMVTEDIDRQVGIGFERIASEGGSKTVLIDAHNSRFESAGEEELKGIQKGSKYIGKYENAIREAVKAGRKRRLRFGSSFVKLSKFLRNPDLGTAYTSLGIFDFGYRKFGMLYIDANNMLPGFRQGIIDHIKGRYGLDVEICTTDTHSVNSIAMSARNVLGRYTKQAEIEPILDTLVERAFEDMEPVKFGSTVFKYNNFMVWGKGSEALLNKVSKDIITIGKRIVPLVIVAAYIIAGWIIYII